MKTTLCFFLAFLFAIPSVHAGPAGKAVRETAEWIVVKFGAGRAGKTIDEVALATARAVERHGDEALPLLRSAGHAGFEALEAAGKQAPDVLRLFATRGDDAVWLISQPRKLAIFMKHGNEAANALIKHPGIADDLIEQLGSKALAPLQRLEKAGAQQFAMAAKEGVFASTARSKELLGVVAKFGDSSMNFIWRNKGALTVTAVLASFLNNPEVYLTGGKDLMSAAVAPLAPHIRWDWLGYGVTAMALICGAVLMHRLLRFRKTATA